jgi:CheY-like chemotaxis protein
MLFRRKKIVPSVRTGLPELPSLPLAAPAVSGTSNGLHRKILVVDDDPVVVQAVSVRLKSEGYTVLSASDGSQALETTRSERPDLMLVDVDLPPDVSGVAWNGFSLTEWVRRLEEAKHIPVILISANNKPEYLQRAWNAGAEAFLPKPIEKNLLLSSITEALMRSRGPRPGGNGPARPHPGFKAENLKRSFGRPAVAHPAERTPHSTWEFGL